MPAEPFYYGGQAVLEGVMMRGRENIAIAVRRPDGELVVATQPLPVIYKGRLKKLPLVRGIIVLVETLALGIQTLLHSAQIVATDEGNQKTEMAPVLLWGTITVGIAFAIALFFIAPLLLIRYLFDLYTSALISNLIEGFLRVGIFIAYLKLISLIPDIRRVFAYHGAEHKVVNAYEAGVPLESETVKGYSTAHARCGTSFLLTVLIVAIIVFAFLGRPPLWASILSRLFLIPVIAALSYEIVRFSATHSHNRLVRTFLIPGLWLQAMTTNEPNDQQLETALSALKKVVEADKGENA